MGRAEENVVVVFPAVLGVERNIGDSVLIRVDPSPSASREGICRMVGLLNEKEHHLFLLRIQRGRNTARQSQQRDQDASHGTLQQKR